MLEISETLDYAGVSVAFLVWESDERLSLTSMDPRSLKRAHTAQQGSIPSRLATPFWVLLEKSGDTTL